MADASNPTMAGSGPPDSGANQVQLARVQAKFVGTGHADTSKVQWANNIHRDSIAVYLGSAPLASYLALARGESIGRERYEMTEAMYAPLVGRESGK
ncbi:splicing factor 3B subunit 5 [Pycnococcus provasolii]|mmetsp:Transcript_10554/g.23854  ORF Transcript_10554/g.23854 Transcript_10554/m.23854 type:complete len:97 (-) Transcript_10554:129-419(-)